MKIQYRHEKFQADAAKAVVDVFAGQPYLTPTYMMNRGSGNFAYNVFGPIKTQNSGSRPCRKPLFLLVRAALPTS